MKTHRKIWFKTISSLNFFVTNKVNKDSSRGLRHAVKPQCFGSDA